MAKATRTKTNIPDNEVFIHKKTTHFHDMVENTNEFQKWFNDTYEADLQKWFNDTSYTKRQINWTEKYELNLNNGGEIKISSQLLESNTPIQKTTLMSATIMSATLNITEYIEILLPVHTTK